MNRPAALLLSAAGITFALWLIRPLFRPICGGCGQFAGHRFTTPHDCFAANCQDLGQEVADLQNRLGSALSDMET